MAVTTLSGVQDDQTLLSNRRVIDMDDTIAQLEPDETEFTQFLLNMPSRPAKSAKVEWLEDELIPRVTVLTANIANATVTTISVATNTGNYFRVNDIIRVAETGENCLVTGVAASTLTVVRGYGTTAATSTSTATGDIIRLGNAASEGQTLGQLLNTKQVAQYNYCQIFRNPAGFTNTLAASELYGGAEPSYEMKKKMREHRISIEYSLFWGQRKLDTTGTNARNVMGGLTDFITTNITNIAGNLTEKNLETFFRTAFRYGSQSKKVLFAAPLIGSAMSSFPQARLAYPNSTGVKVHGVSLAQYQSAQGQNVNIVIKRDWNDFQATTGFWGAYGVLVDTESTIWRPLRPTKLLLDRQAPDEDSVKQEYLTEASVEIQHDRRHAILKNATGY